jgi:uncharacterized protein (DUF885 family)
MEVMRPLLLLAVVLAAAPCFPEVAMKPAPDPTTANLHALLEREWDEEMRREPTEASELGDRRFGDKWPDVSLDELARNQAHDQAVLAELHKIDRGKLPPDEQLNYDLFEYQLKIGLEEMPHEWHLVPLGTFSGIQTTGNLADRLRFETVKDYEDWVARLRAFPLYVRQTIALLQRGIERKRIQPKSVVTRIQGQVAKILHDDPTASTYYKPFAEFPETVPAADRERLAKAAREAITQQLTPALKELKAFLDGPYLAAAPERPGVWQFPGGKELYAYLARRSTTTDLTPQQIHDLGLKEVARIRAEMEKLKDQVGFKGTLPEFFSFLRNDERFRFKSPEEVLEKTRAFAKRIDPTLMKLFRTFPRIPYGIEPIPEAQAADASPYYNPPSADGSRAGYYYVNTLRTEPLWSTAAIALHETVPGHHFQIALAMEQESLPKFRRFGSYTAYTEGWGLYAEFLGEELGIYDDPYQKFGRLSNEMWRAVRLVVDTGIHDLGWERQKAIDYFLSQAPTPEDTITAEVDRYIAWPGQALAYKIGELKLKELRQRATQKLGARFDLKEFHDVVLLSGALPLAVLEKSVDAWIARKLAS